MVRRGLAASRTLAVELIEHHRVLVDGVVADKPARQVSAAQAILLSAPAARFVSRGGEKLEAALEGFHIDVTGKTALDAGASTGGFTDCLLQRGAASVVGVDVGYGQLHERLRSDGRVVLIERTNIRHLDPAQLGGQAFDIVVADLSFISLRTVAKALVSLTKPDGDMVVLVKPQFEAGRAVVSRGKGIVSDPQAWSGALVDVGCAMESCGASIMEAMVSPIRGSGGNVEFLMHLRADREPSVAWDPAALVDQALATWQ